jgi:hypothetical protein
VQHIPPDSPLHQLSDDLKRAVTVAQSTGFADSYPTAADLCGTAFSDLKLALPVPHELKDQPPTFLGDLSSKELVAFFYGLLLRNGVPPQALLGHATTIAHRIQLLRAFHQPDQVIEQTCKKIVAIVAGFPTTADRIRRGNNPGNVLDPYMLAAVQTLICGGDFERAISATIAHKILMMIEGLLGHLHEDVIGALRGNVRVPEPRGRDQETLDWATNPFPGADVLQPPTANRELRFFQVKSKTGSAKGGDGQRLGTQLKRLTDTYGGSAFYVALIGNTLRGHRSLRGVLRAAPAVVVLVGEAAFRELTGSAVGPHLLLRLYQAAFAVAAKETGYSLDNMVLSIYHEFRVRTQELGAGFLEAVLHDAITGLPAQQDSRHYLRSSRG